MILLAIETTSYAGGIALLDTEERRPVAVVELSTKVDHSRKLLDSINFALDKAGLTIDSLGAVAVSLGPGSFTGVRIGLTHAKMLAWTRSLPLIGVSALEALAAHQGEVEAPVCALIPARKGEVFAGVYRVKVKDELMSADTLLEPICVPVSQVLATIKRTDFMTGNTASGDIIFCGAGVDRHMDDIHAAFAGCAQIAPAWRRYPSPVSVGLIALGRLSDGRHDDPAGLEPLYIRHEHEEFKAAPPQIDV